MQSKRMSMIESATNVVIGYVLGVITQIIMFSILGVHLPLEQNLLTAFVFSVVSLIRSYALRRVFNKIKS